MSDDIEEQLLRARAMVLHDLEARGAGEAAMVDIVEDIVNERRWWVEQWPEGVSYVAGQIAQDVQDRLLEIEGRWPTCSQHTDEPLQVDPELGPDPWWACERGCGRVSPLGALPPASRREPQ